MALDGADAKFTITFEDRLDIREDKLTETEKKSTVTVDVFASFWNKFQDKQLSDEEARKLVLRHTPDKYEYDDGDDIAVTHNIWVDIFASTENELFDPAKEELYADMDQPMSNYYINSSYGTCLSGNQLMGRLTAQRYMDVLRAGVRCIDAKIYDGDRGEPIVSYGHGLTGKMLFVG
jgi:hypothetical protein